jgi:hypothetical protein
MYLPLKLCNNALQISRRLHPKYNITWGRWQQFPGGVVLWAAIVAYALPWRRQKGLKAVASLGEPSSADPHGLFEGERSGIRVWNSLGTGDYRYHLANRVLATEQHQFSEKFSRIHSQFPSLN